MKRIGKTPINIIRYLISTCIVVLLFGLSYQVLSETYLNKEIENDGSSYHNLPLNSMDVLALGSSHAQYSFSPAFFYEDTGLYSYVLGTGGQPLEVSYEMLKEGLKTQSPKLVILEVYTAMPLRSAAEGVYNYILPEYQMTGQEKYNTINYLHDEKREQLLNDFITTHNDWKDDWVDINKIKKAIYKVKNDITNTRIQDYTQIDSCMGYLDNPAQYPVENYWYPYNTYDYLDVELDELDQQSLDNIFNLCQEKGIELLLYKTPIDSLDQENISYLHKVWEWAESKNVKYVDFIELAPKLDFCMWLHSDSFHCYTNGAGIITAYLSDVVNNQEYVFEHKENDLLTKLNKTASSFLTVDYLRYECNPKKYYIRMRNYSNLLLVRYNSCVCSESTKNFLNEYGIDPNENYYGIFDNGSLIEANNEEINIDYNEHNYKINFNSISVDGVVLDESGGELTFGIYNEPLYSYVFKSTNVRDTWGWNEPFYGNY